jgi:hypothetical protein
MNVPRLECLDFQNDTFKLECLDFQNIYSDLGMLGIPEGLFLSWNALIFPECIF